MGKMRLVAVAACATALMGMGASAAFAGEITGNGKPLWTSTTVGPTGEVSHTLHGKSACAFSGQEDLQFADGGSKGVPGHAQSWGQIARNAGGALGGVPGTACNPTKGETQEP